MAAFNDRGYTGINENTAPKHFALLKSEGFDVDWSHFWSWAKRNYTSIPNDHSWIGAGVFVRYFSEHYEGRCAEFNRLFAIHEKRKGSSDNAYDAPKKRKSKKRNGSGGSNGSGGDEMVREAITRALEMNKGEALRLKGLLGELS